MYGILLYDIRSTDASVFLYQPLLAHMPSPGRMYNGPSPKTQELPAFEKIQVDTVRTLHLSSPTLKSLAKIESFPWTLLSCTS